jgi:predicted nucleotidyltransferase
MKEIKDHIAQITQLCDTHDVRSLFAFGSIVSGNLNINSDIDLVVDIENSDPITYSDNYFDLKSQLENIFARPIDLLESNSIKNPFLKQQINDTKVLVYGR